MTSADKKCAFITGSSRGVGAATAIKLSELGYDVVLNCSQSKTAAELVETQCKERGANTLLLVGDVADDGFCREAISAIMTKYGRIDALVNNAATTKFVTHTNLEGLSAEDFQRIYAVNVIGPYQLTRAASEHLKDVCGTVVNVASHAGIIGMGSSIAYCCSKAALINQTKSLARVLEGVRVNAVCPGFIAGDWLADGLGEAYESIKKSWEDVSPLGATCDSDTVAQVICDLVTSMPLVTGEALLLDGGFNLNGMTGGGARR